MSGVNGCDKHPDRVIDCCIECLKLELSDYIDTVKAMLFAARGGECDIETLQKEMDAVSTKPSEYIRFIVSSKNEEIARLKDEVGAFRDSYIKAVEISSDKEVAISKLENLLSEARKNQIEINTIRANQAETIVSRERAINQMVDALRQIKATVSVYYFGDDRAEGFDIIRVTADKAINAKDVISATNGVVDKLRADLTVIASQKTTAEMSEQEKQDADGCYEEAYDMMVAHARRALAPEGG